MEFDIVQIIQWGLGFIVVPLIAGWYNLKERVTKLESKVDTNTKSIEKIHTDRKDITEEMKEMNGLLHQVLIKLTELETRQKIRDEAK